MVLKPNQQGRCLLGLWGRKRVLPLPASGAPTVLDSWLLLPSTLGQVLIAPSAGTASATTRPTYKDPVMT